MNDTQATRVILPWTAAICLLIAFSLLGLVGPVLTQMLKDFGATTDDVQLWLRVIVRFHWVWTTPLAVAGGIVLIVGSKRWPARTTRFVGITYLLISLLVALMMVAWMFTGIRINGTVAEPTPAGHLASLAP